MDSEEKGIILTLWSRGIFAALFEFMLLLCDSDFGIYQYSEGSLGVNAIKKLFSSILARWLNCFVR
jgi:hypothetical protein